MNDDAAGGPASTDGEVSDGHDGRDTDDGADPDGGAGEVGALLTQAGTGYVRLSTDGRVDAVNEAFVDLVGFPHSDLVGEPFGAVVVDGNPLADADLPVSTTLRLATAEGERVPATGHFRRAGDDVVVAVVSERTAADTAFDSGFTYGQTFGALAQAVPDGIIVLDTDSQVRYANPAVERILGYEPAELVGTSKVEIIPDRLRDAHLDALDAYLETGERNINWTYVELPGQHRDGHEVPLGISLNDFTYGGDRYFVGLFRDVSRRKRAERTLEEKVTQLETVAHLGREALATTELRGLFETVASRTAAALDASSCAVLEHDTAREVLSVRAEVGLDRVGELDVATHDGSQVAETLSAAEPVVVEDCLASPRFDAPLLVAGHEARSGITVTIGPAADPWGVLAVHDDDPRSFADHDVDFVESVATILAAAVERTRHERELNETVARLEESNERLENFAHAASHDLKEPLRMVSSYLRLLEQQQGDRLDSEGEEYLAFAVDGADRMREMIEALLAYSRVETRGEAFEPVDLGSLVDDVRDDLRVRLAEADATLTTDTLPTVYGDPDQLRQVFGNLLDNAIEYSGDGSPRIHVSASRDRGECVVSVTDDGIGIPAEHAESVFDVFERLHTHDEHPGTGIGLSLCRRIVQRHDGEIWVDSEPDEGTTVSLTLPVPPADGAG